MKITKQIKDLMLTESGMIKLSCFQKHATNAVRAIGEVGHSLFIVVLWNTSDCLCDLSQSKYTIETFALIDRHDIQL